jgi:hypothetical protein
MAITFRYTPLNGQPTLINATSTNIVDIVGRYDYIYVSWPASTRILEESHHSGIAHFMALMAGECSGAPRPPTERRH